VAVAEMSAPEVKKKNEFALVRSPFEQHAVSEGYNLTPAVSPIPTRIYADRRTQEAFDDFQAGARALYRMLDESTFQTPALLQNIRRLAGVE
jgi:hypothetical protein